MATAVELKDVSAADKLIEIDEDVQAKRKANYVWGRRAANGKTKFSVNDVRCPQPKNETRLARPGCSADSVSHSISCRQLTDKDAEQSVKQVLKAVQPYGPQWERNIIDRQQNGRCRHRLLAVAEWNASANRCQRHKSFQRTWRLRMTRRTIPVWH
jgi:hypothetical protein